MMLAHRIALDPTPEQRIAFARACGTARFAWNWALGEWRRQHAKGEKPSALRLARQLNAKKRIEWPWMLDVSKTAPQHAIRALGNAFQRFFRKQARYPNFKRKGVHDAFRADNGPGTFCVEGRRIQLRKVGWVRMRETLRFAGRPMSVTVSRTADRWYASIVVEVDWQVPARENQAVGGVDLGVTTLATLHDGRRMDGPRALRQNLAKLQRLGRDVSRKQPGSANRKKARMRLARQHARIANIRRDSLHKLTTALVREFAVLGIEDLNVRGMLANRQLARAISDVGLYEFRRQLEYKAAMYGTQVVVADRWFPSSKRCANCELEVDSLPLGMRTWICSGCGTEHDRDLNAARNLREMAAGRAVTACGAEGSGSGTRRGETGRSEAGTSATARR